MVSPAHGSRVLVVEDDVHLLEGVRTVLEMEGYDVLTAENGRRALDVLQTVSPLPELIVSDIMMPVMSGFEFFEAVRQQERYLGIPFIFLTALGERTHVRHGKMLGVDDYLVKPFDADELLASVGARLKRQRDLDRRSQGEIRTVKQNIMSILHHEFHTPLTFVVAYADMLNSFGSTSLSDAEILDFMRGVNTGATRLRHLVEKFILLVELETGDARRNYELRRAPIHNLPEMITTVRDKILSLFPDYTVQLDLPRYLPPFIADADMLKTTVEELLRNAVKFSPPDRPIDVKISHVDGWTLIAVRDHGRGIPEDEQGKIFEPFYQIDRAKYEDQGSGAGLAIVRGIMTLHHGQVTVESAPGLGSTFTLYFPEQPPA
jgi:signal transduction histidine kinase